MLGVCQNVPIRARPRQIKKVGREEKEREKGGGEKL